MISYEAGTCTTLDQREFSGTMVMPVIALPVQGCDLARAMDNFDAVDAAIPAQKAQRITCGKLNVLPLRWHDNISSSVTARIPIGKFRLWIEAETCVIVQEMLDFGG